MKKTVSTILAVLMAVSLAATAFAADTSDSCPAWGDVDFNGIVDVMDARSVLRTAIQLDTFTDEQKRIADFDGNGITVNDARSVLRVAILLDTAPAHVVESGRCALCGKVIDASQIVPAPVTENNQYNILNGTTYTIIGTMTDSSGIKAPMTIVRDGDKMFMQSEMDGTSIGILVRDNKLYMLTADHNYSLEFSSSVRGAMDLSDADYNDMMDVSNYTIDAPSLDLAEESTVIEGDKAYTVYTFTHDAGSQSVVKMDGDRLVSITTYTKSGKTESETTFDTVLPTANASYFALPSNALHRYSTVAGMALFLAQLL